MKGLARIGMWIAIATGAAALAQSPLAGRWKGTINGIPAVNLTVRNDGGKVSGTALFYMIKSNPGGSGAHVFAKTSGPMEDLKTGADALTFDMHRKDGSVASFRVELRPDGHAKLFLTNEGADTQGKVRLGPPRDGVDLVRER